MGTAVMRSDGAMSVEAEHAERVEQTLAQGFPALSFPAALETHFLSQAEGSRRRAITEAGLAAVCLFAGMVVADVLLTPDTVKFALWVRLLVFGPVVLIGLAVLNVLRIPWLTEWLIVLAGMFAVALTALILLQAEGRWAVARLVEINIIVVYTCTLARFWPALALGAFTFAVQLGLVSVLPDFTGVLAINTTLLLGAVAVFTLYGNYTLERDERLAYLLAQREQALQDALHTSHQQLTRMARTDALTEVANRRHAEDFLAQTWAHAQQRQTPMALVMIDIDHFKRYNDHHGHLSGDRCLQAVARALSACSRRAGDLVARLGGEEFVLVMNDIDHASALSVAQRIQASVQALGVPHGGSPGVPVVTVSVGVASMRPRPGDEALLLMKRADDALYAAKAQGRNRVCDMGCDGVIHCAPAGGEGRA